MRNNGNVQSTIEFIIKEVKASIQENGMLENNFQDMIITRTKDFVRLWSY